MSKTVVTLLFLIIMLIVLSILFNFSQISTQIIPKQKTEIQNLTSPTPQGASVVSLKVPAIARLDGQEESGVIATLTVEARPGKGRVLVEINQLFFFLDTQNSIRTAKMVAENLTKIDFSKYDLIYNIETNASVIGGPSAGAALAIGTIAAIENKTVNPEVVITGTIEEDGSIGPVGGILEKAKATRDSGATIFLVPLGQGVQNNYIPVKTCQQFGSFTFCQTQYKLQSINISKDVDIEVREVKTAEEALKYFLT